MTNAQQALVLDYQPHIYLDRLEPFPIRWIGYTVFTQKGLSSSWPGLSLDPQASGAAAIIEYAIYFDYDIQHLYDLEHIWVAVGRDGAVTDCWCSFHGMQLRAAGLSCFRLEGTHPVLYAQPGKHAMLPAPELFELHPQFHTACTENAGGGLLIPPMLAGRMETNPLQDAKIRQYIRQNFAFTPSLDFRLQVPDSRWFIPWPELLEKIPGMVATQLALIQPNITLEKSNKQEYFKEKV